ncbi:Calx-beta domain-containing protein [Thauera mechernichensis]
MTNSITGTSLSEQIIGTSGDDTIYGLGGHDTIDGQAGNDWIHGGDGDDRIEGNFGNDSLYGGNGNDILTDDQGSNLLDGGAGNDWLTSRSLSGQHTLLGGTGNDVLNATGQAVYLDGGEQDDALNVTGRLEQGGSTSYVVGGSATLLGGAGTDRLNVSYYSNASLDGGEGNDNLRVEYTRSATLQGGTGEDALEVYVWGDASARTDGDSRLSQHYELDGGDDNDTLSVSGYNSVWAGQTTASLRGGAGNDTLQVIDRSAGDTGTDGGYYGIARATLDGGAGDDTLEAGGVLQLTLTGGDGADRFVLTAQQYRTLLEGTRNFENVDGSRTAVTADPVVITDFAAGVGGDVLDYGDLLRNGTLAYDGSNPFGTGFLILEQAGSDTLLSFDPDGAAGQAEGPVVVAVLKNVTAATLVADNFNPNYPPDGSTEPGWVLTGTSLSEPLQGGFGDDTIYGLGGNDTIDGQAGNDWIHGGDGDDVIEGNFGNDSLYGGNGNDRLSDDQGSNLLDGGAGNDWLTSRSLSGQHTLLGGTGNDVLNATGQAVYLDGGEQDDVLNVTGRLEQGGSTSYVVGGSATLLGGAGTDRLNVSYYSNASLDGGEGNDNLRVEYTRSATLQGGTGEDALEVYVWGDASARTDGDSRLSQHYELDGGDDNDTLSVSGYNSVWAGQTTASLRGGAGNDTLQVIDRSAGDTGTDGGYYGIARATLDGGAGDDTLEAGGVLQLTLTGGDGADRFVLTAQQYRTLLEGTRNFENVDGSRTAVTADPVVITDFAAGVGGDVLDYGDLLRNGTLAYDGSNPFGTGFLILEQAGSDTLLSFDPDGAAGQAEGPVVVAVLKNVTAATLVADNFNPNYPPDGSTEPGWVLTGTSLSEPLQGGFGDDTIYGLGGNDTIDGQAGNDWIHGGDGDDVIEGNFGNDSLYGGNGNDRLSDDQGSNLLDGGAGNDWLTSRSLSGQHTLLGGTGNDVLNATGQAVYLDGGEQDDVLNVTGRLEQGGSTSYVVGGSATLLGGAGTDRLNVSYYSNASLDGGEGNDNLRVEYTRSATLQGGTGEDALEVYVWGDASARTDGDSRLSQHYELDGGDDNDTLSVSGYNSVWAGQTTASLRGGAGNDTLQVIDRSAGDTGTDGGYYGIARATLDGGAGDDTLEAGGVLQLTLTGGDGADRFVLTAQQYRTLLEGTRNFENVDGSRTAVTADPVVITDFAAGVGGDVLDYGDLLRNGTLAYDGSNPFGTGFLILEQAGSDTLLSFNPDGAAGQAEGPVVVAVLKNVTAATLVADNFHPNFELNNDGVTPPVNSPPTGSVTISGTATQGQTLTASHTLADEDGLGTINYQWLANGVAISGAIDSIYTLTQAEVGKAITVVASYSDGGGTGESVTSAATEPVVADGCAEPPVNPPPSNPTIGDGMVTTPIGLADDFGYSVALQPDGKIVVAGQSWNGTSYDLALVRYNENGSLDSSFNGSGKVTKNSGELYDSRASVAVQADGKVLIGGTSWDGERKYFTVVRYNADGSLDSGFGEDGQVQTAFGYMAYGHSMALQADGKILLAGVAGGARIDDDVDFALVRYNSDGSPDLSFNGDGKVLTDLGAGSEDWGSSVTVQPDGKILVAGDTDRGPALVRYNADGSLDTAFSDDGIATATSGSSFLATYGVAIQPDGKILLTGEDGYRLFLIRFNADGSLDTGFGVDGKVLLGGDSIGYGVSPQPDGKILVAGWINDGIAVARFFADGSIDSDFGTGGIAKPTSGVPSGMGRGVIVQPDGKILVVGESWGGQDSDFALVRFNTDGTLDSTFGADIGDQHSPILISGNAEFQIDAWSQGYQINPAGASSVNGASLVVWQSRGQDGDGWGVYGRVLHGGVPFGPEIRISQTSSGDQLAPSVTALKDGSFLVVWLDRVEVRGVFVSSDGVLTGDQFIVPGSSTLRPNENDSLGLAHPVAHELASGEIVISWHTSPFTATHSDVVFSIIDRDLSVVAESIVANVTLSNYQNYPHIFSSSEGGFGLIWQSVNQDGPGLDIFLRLYNAQGVPIGSETRVNQSVYGNQTIGGIAQAIDGAVLVVWFSEGVGVFGRFLDINGQANGDEFLIAQDKWPITAAISVSNISVLSVSSDLYVVALTYHGIDGSYQGLQGLVVSSAGQLIGESFPINLYSDLNQARPVLISSSSEGNKGFLAVWQSEGQFDDSFDIVGRFFEYSLGGNRAPTGTVTIAGAAVVNMTLNASNDLADLDGLGPISYQWMADGAAILGANGCSYTLTQAEVGKVIKVSASYVDGGGTVESVTSAATEPVAEDGGWQPPIDPPQSSPISLLALASEAGVDVQVWIEPGIVIGAADLELKVAGGALLGVTGVDTWTALWQQIDTDSYLIGAFGLPEIGGSVRTLLATLSFTTEASANTLSITLVEPLLGNDVVQAPPVFEVPLKADLSVTAEAVTVAETAGSMSFDVELAAPLLTSETVSWVIEGVGPHAATAADFGGGAMPSGTLTFAAGETRKTITVTIADDVWVEHAESFRVRITEASGGVLLDADEVSETVSIADDDVSIVSIEALTPALSEAEAGTNTSFSFKITLDQAPVAAQSLSWSVTGSGINAADAADFVGGLLPQGVVTFAAGETEKQIDIVVLGDDVREFDEGFTVSLSDPSAGIQLGDSSSASALILTDDAPLSDLTGQVLTRKGQALPDFAAQLTLSTLDQLDLALLQETVGVDGSRTLRFALTVDSAAQAFGAFDLALRTEAGVEIVGLTLSDAFASWTSIPNPLSAQQLLMGAFSTNPDPASDLSGELALGELVVRMGADHTGPLRIAVEGLALGAAPVQSGVLRYESAEDLGAGQFAFLGLEDGQIDLSFVGSISNIGRSITAQDALEALRLAVRLPSDYSDAYGLISADYNQDGRVTSQDALEILKASVRMPGAIQPKWVFLADEADLSAVNSRNTGYKDGLTLEGLPADASHNFTAVLLGDVNDSLVFV